MSLPSPASSANAAVAHDGPPSPMTACNSFYILAHTHRSTQPWKWACREVADNGSGGRKTRRLRPPGSEPHRHRPGLDVDIDALCTVLSCRVWRQVPIPIPIPSTQRHAAAHHCAVPRRQAPVGTPAPRWDAGRPARCEPRTEGWTLPRLFSPSDDGVRIHCQVPSDMVNATFVLAKLRSARCSQPAGGQTHLRCPLSVLTPTGHFPYPTVQRQTTGGDPYACPPERTRSEYAALNFRLARACPLLAISCATSTLTPCQCWWQVRNLPFSRLARPPARLPVCAPVPSPCPLHDRRVTGDW